MSLDKPSPDIPGTTVFDAGQSRKGYQLRDLTDEAGVGERMLSRASCTAASTCCMPASAIAST
jgi:hypothetical protein